MQEAADEVRRAVGVDRPGPAKIDPHVRVVLGDRDQLIAVRIRRVHQHEPCLGIAREQRAEVSRSDPVDRHLPGAGVVTRVELEGQVVLDGELDTLRPAPVTQHQPRRLLDLAPGQHDS